MCFLGYPYGQVDYKVYDLETRKQFVSKEVKFYETEFLFQDQKAPDDDDYQNTLPIAIFEPQDLKRQTNTIHLPL
jgi:hypothetical protein